MSLPMVVVVLDEGREDSSYREIGLVDGKITIDAETQKTVVKFAKCYAKSYENGETLDMLATVVDEKGQRLADLTLEEPYTFIWGNDKQEIIHRFLVHDFNLEEV